MHGRNEKYAYRILIVKPERKRTFGTNWT